MAGTCCTCGSPCMCLDRNTGEMKCENGHVNYVGSPDHMTPSNIEYDFTKGKMTTTEYMPNNIFENGKE